VADVQRGLLDRADAADVRGRRPRAAKERRGGVANASVLEHRTLGPVARGSGVQGLNDGPAEAQRIVLQRLDLLLECGLRDHACMVHRHRRRWGIETVHPR